MSMENVNMPSGSSIGRLDIEQMQLRDLIKLRGSIKKRMTTFSNFVAVLNQIEVEKITSIQFKELNIRLNKFEGLYFEFDAIQSKLDITSDEQQSERETIENQYYSVVSIAQEIIESYNKYFNSHKKDNDQSLHSCHSNCTKTCNSNYNIKLPTINLPTFDGNYLKWLEFRDTFESLINSNEYISSISKFHYLKSSLEGSATVVLKSIEFTSENYKVAWELLCSRYDNKKVLINNHIKALFSLEPITRESYKAIRFLIDHVIKNLRALDNLGQPTDKWDVLIIYIISTKLDSITLGKWEEYRSNSSDIPTLSNFTEFLRNRADILETMSQNKVDNKPRHDHHNNNNKHFFNNKNVSNNKSFVTSGKINTLSCPLCKQQHKITECSAFSALTPQDRSKEVIRLNLCSNCLRRGHIAAQCRLGNCRFCKLRHNTLLHIEAVPSNDVVPTSVTLSAQSTSQVLLGTALIRLVNPKTKKTVTARTLLDAGSQSSFITHNLKNKLELIGNDIGSLCISGINNSQLVSITDSCHLIVESLVNAYNFSLNCLVIPQITGHLPNCQIDVSNLEIPSDIQLADPKFHQPAEIDMLLGAEVFFTIMSASQIKLGPGKPTLQKTKLGWLVVGPLNDCNLPHKKKVYCNFNKQISEQLSKFWSLEEVSLPKKPLSLDQEFCEAHFTKYTKRLSDGRFSVLMPIREQAENLLGDSYKMAKRRFFSLEKKLDKNQILKKEYSDFINEYKELNHLSKIEKPLFGYYMPHHAVIRESSETTKLRVVFDASAKTTSNKSLNDIQCIGPVIQDQLFDILVRFRQHEFVLTGDITKMYRQVLIQEAQRNLQLILWRNNSSENLETLQLNTVTYGTASAPFLSTRCLLQLALECSDPFISEIIKRDFYVDDLLTGSSSQSTLIHIYKGIIEKLSSGGFPIHKFRTNCSQIVSSDTSDQSLNFSKESSVLGVLWSPQNDTLGFSINLTYNENEILTKRVILSNTCKIFDPLGLLSPCVITLKITLQKLWLLKLEWDDPVPNDIKKYWCNVITNLKTLISVSVPRHVLCASPVATELHCFVDASQEAYAACVYMRTVDTDSIVTIKLLCSKTRVAPLQPTTIPRLELCAAQLGARLVSKVSEAFRCNIARKLFWSDSTITLSWIKTQPKLCKIFVCNRVNEIHELTDRESWKYVPTNQNPADIASRGISPNNLVKSSLWWRGPSFLLKPETEWPQSPSTAGLDLPELKVHHVQDTVTTNKFITFEKFSSVNKLKRTFAYVFRFVYNCKPNAIKIKGTLNSNEIDNSFNYLIKMCQSESFTYEIDTLRKNKSLSKKSLILQLCPFIDDNGILRVGGRLDNADINYNKKHPVLLDAKHHFTKILMSAEHLRLFHAGPQLLLSSFREQFWPIGGRNLARNTVRKCLICVKLAGKTMQPLMGNLPTGRVSPSHPFQICGTDFAGPFFISNKKGRGSRVTKCYLCIFICFSTKAIHLEIVSDLSTQSFILCLKRFISRRGKPDTIHCDNGKNFVGASNELGKALRSGLRSIKDFSVNEGIKFKFNPPYSPTFGGLWEAGVKSAKHHLKRIVGNRSLTYEALDTLFTQIEAILNSRPLTPLTSQPNDLSPLTPGHFLIGRPLTSLPQAATEVKTNIRTRYQLIEQLRLHFWNRWRNEYLAELQQRIKWRSPQYNLKIGDMVVLKEDNVPALRWRLGRVNQLYPGHDGTIRVADFTTSRGIERRAINRVCLLPIPAPHEEHDEMLKDDETAFNRGQDVTDVTRRGSARVRGARGAAGAAGATRRNGHSSLS